jgi:tight adherence protein C
MDMLSFLGSAEFLWSPPVFGVLAGLAAALIWVAIAPSQPLRAITGRLDGYVEAQDVVEELEMGQPFARRAVVPLVRRLLGLLGRLVPLANVEETRRRLIQAGNPGGLTALDFLGLRVLLLGLLGGGYFLLVGRSAPSATELRNALLVGAGGFFLPTYWLTRRVRQRKKEITHALPDALDMLTIGVEAGLAFESALLRVAQQWQNALTEEFRRAVQEMRLGSAREEALTRMADRAGVDSLGTFVAVLVQSTRLGVSIADVLHSQAHQMRVKRRQLAEEQARQAGVKMVFPLVFLIFPAIFVVILGPSVPGFLDFFANAFAGTGGLP